MVRVASVQGSAPREVGAQMIVHGDGVSGTIGGGRLEFDAIAHARSLSALDVHSDRQELRLGPEMGQCCGGKVTLDYKKVSQKDAEILGRSKDETAVYIFGGGHVGLALVQALSALPISVKLVETRSDYLRDLPFNVEPIELAAPESAIRTAPSGAAFIIVTHDHALDFLIVEEALRRGDASYVGMIGSKSKRAVLEAQLRAAKVDPAPLICPIGQAGLGDKRPEVIAAFVAAEVLSKIGGT